MICHKLILFALLFLLGTVPDFFAQETAAGQEPSGGGTLPARTLDWDLEIRGEVGMADADTTPGEDWIPTSGTPDVKGTLKFFLADRSSKGLASGPLVRLGWKQKGEWSLLGSTEYGNSLKESSAEGFFGLRYAADKKSGNWKGEAGIFLEMDVNHSDPEFLPPPGDTTVNHGSDFLLGVAGSWDQKFSTGILTSQVKPSFFLGSNRDSDAGEWGFKTEGSAELDWGSPALELRSGFQISQGNLPRVEWEGGGEGRWVWPGLTLGLSPLVWDFSISYPEWDRTKALGQKQLYSSSGSLIFKDGSWSFSVEISKIWHSVIRTAVNDPSDQPLIVSLLWKIGNSSKVE